MLRSRVKTLERQVDRLQEDVKFWRDAHSRNLRRVLALANYFELGFEELPATTPKIVVVSTKVNRRKLSDAQRIKMKIHTKCCSYNHGMSYCNCNGKFIKGRAKELMTKIHKSNCRHYQCKSCGPCNECH